MDALITEFGPAITYHVKYLEQRLRIVQTVGTIRDQVRFSLDPLAEYLAAMYLLERNGSDESLWRQFFAEADRASDGGLSRTGFSLALRDCCQTKGNEFKVPKSASGELNGRVGALSAAARA